MTAAGGTRASRRLVVAGRYEVEALPLARGGMGEVYLGRDTRLEREIAVKFVRFPDDQEDTDLVRRFVRESRITAKLQHPGVPAVYDAGQHDGRPYMVMQRIHGISVADLIAENGKLPVGWAAAIAAQACAVLTVAHGASLIHRDLKPGNLMLDTEGCVKILDFGLAVALDGVDASQITRSGQSLGTPAYMAPEQILAGMSGPRTDLYGLGCTLYEMLAGHPVFAATTAFAVMSKQVTDPPPLLRRAGAPTELVRLVAAMLAKKPEDRPASADEVYRILLPHATDLAPLPSVLNPPTVPSPARMYARVLSRVLAEPAALPSGAPPAGPDTGHSDVERPDSEPSIEGYDRDDLDRARAEADSLIRQSRYSQAADVLAAAVEPATRVFGAVDDSVISLRLQYADVLFEGGDYHHAAPAYQQLAVDLAARRGPDAETVLRCRLQEATCHALVGETGLALRQLQALLVDHRRIHGEDDTRTLELRRQIGLLQLGAGQRSTAERTLGELAADIKRLRGPGDPAVAALTNLLDGLHRTSHH